MLLKGASGLGKTMILDELGCIPCDSRAADILYNIISRRHAERSTIISTNLAFKQWGTVFPGAACVAVLIDRFNQHCHKLLITADSWRDRARSDSLVDRQITTELAAVYSGDEHVLETSVLRAPATATIAGTLAAFGVEAVRGTYARGSTRASSVPVDDVGYQATVVH